MSRRYFEFSLRVRPIRHRYRPHVGKVVTVKIVARSQHEAILAYQATATRMTVIACVKGREVPPPRSRV